MSPGTVTGHSVRVAEVRLREFTVPAPAAALHHPAVRPDIRRDPVHGWLVGVSDGLHWGWWGPVDQAVAARVPGLLAAAFSVLPAQVDAADFARRLRRATRHGHTGLLALSVGALELALWDLLGQRAGLPVWSLLRPQAVEHAVPAYATCFGVDPTPSRVPQVMDEVADGFAVQKWHPDVLGAELIELTKEFAARRGPGRLAVDFHGAWPPERVRDACRPLGDALAWVEEPYHPDEVDTARADEFAVPHAAGEHCYAPADAAQLRAGHVDVWQPDAVFCGGLVNLLRLVRAAARAGARCAPHGGGFLPALHLAAAGERIDLVELHLLLEPRRSVHFAEPPALKESQLAIPTAPGWCGELRTDLFDG
ncbi:D-galactarolactone cycloisomerase [Kitasatospora sp. MAP12-15]|uniref:enolase C-terminal domain-like protein n=1 Tax=unclassified Kitasatospora TaxID=2633591 RepID=UPI0024764340|nr:enolase C-terminal domain-like protein [Kitasatospora sp. MAP12-44]MDH6108194.1 D-galactarolactone cycloisomerase [Kitasatospora sp. MAP12-44]